MKSMEIILEVILLAFFGGPGVVSVIWLGYYIVSNLKYRSKNIESDYKVFFFADGKFVLNTLFLYSVPVDEIDYIQFNYDSREAARTPCYSLSMLVVKKDGKMKRTTYPGNVKVPLARPSEMIAALEGKGIRCIDAAG